MTRNQIQSPWTLASRRVQFSVCYCSCATSTTFQMQCSTVRLFADDCLLYRSIRNMDDHLALERDLQQLETWGMGFNAKKCYLMSINQKSAHFYQQDDQILQQVPDNPYLGVTLSDDMKWNSHINKISKKANSTLGFLKRNLKHCPQDSRRTAYLSLVRSTLEYSSIVWDPYLQKDTDKLEKVQLRAARFITGNYTSRDQGCVSQMLAELNLPPLQDRRKANRLTFFFKVVPAMQSHDFLTPVLGKRLMKSKQYTDCVTSNIIDKQSTNNCKCFKTVQCKTEIFKNSFFPRTQNIVSQFFPRTIIDWNHLDDNIVRAETVDSFRKAVHH